MFKPPTQGNDFTAVDLESSQTRMYHFPTVKELPTSFPSLEQINSVMDNALKNYNQKTLPVNRIEKTMVLRET
jgi:hypothetical protein